MQCGGIPRKRQNYVMGWPQLQLVMLGRVSLDPLVVRQGHLHDRAVTRTAVMTPRAISHGQMRGIAQHQSAQSPEERGECLLSHSALLHFLLSFIEHPQRSTVPSSPAHCDRSTTEWGLQVDSPCPLHVTAWGGLAALDVSVTAIRW